MLIVSCNIYGKYMLALPLKLADDWQFCGGRGR
jgi:hypothetical protein